MKKAAKWLLCINLLAWTLLAVQVLTVNMEQRVAQNTVPVQNGDVQAKGEDADAVKKKVALTFDDGPDPDYTEMLLDGLKKRNVKATFFLLGKQAEAYPDIVKRMHKEGHMIGNHSYDHVNLANLSKTDAAKQISASAFIDACQLLGDAQAQLSGVAMHSATKSYLKKLNLIETERDSTDVEFDTYQGRRVTVDDGCPVTSGGVYTTYLFGNGAVAYGNGSPVGFVATEVDRDKQTGGGIDYLINRKAFILHPRGIAYTGAKREHVETPLRTELAMAENWKPVYEPKQLRIVAIKHKIG